MYILSLLGPTILDKKGTINPLPPQSNDEGTKGQKRAIFGIIEMGGRGGPDVPFIFSKIVASLAFFSSFFSRARLSSLYSSHYFRPCRETVEVEDEVDYRKNYLRLSSQQPDNKALK